MTNTKIYDDIGQLMWEIEEGCTDSENRVHEDEKALDEHQAEDF